MNSDEIFSSEFVKFVEFLKERKIPFYFKESLAFFEVLLDRIGSSTLQKSDYMDFDTSYNFSNISKESKANWIIFITNSAIEIESEKKKRKVGFLPIVVKNKLEFSNNKYIFTKEISAIRFLLEEHSNQDIIKLLSCSSFESLREAILSPYKKLLLNMQAVYIFGAQTLGEKIFNHCTKSDIKVLGFIDNDKNKQGKAFCGKNILSPDDFTNQKDTPIVIASISYLFEIYQQLRNLNFNIIIPYPLLSLADEKKFPSEKSYEGMQRDLVENKFNYISLFLNLGDQKSRMVLNGLISYRMTLDFRKLDPIIDPIENQNFEGEIFDLSSNELFVDGGAYNGDTARRFIQEVQGSYKKIILFEPDPGILQKAKDALRAYDRIEFINKGLFSTKSRLKFMQTGGLGGALDEKGSLPIPVVSLDEELSEKITFLKLDVEGVEQEVLLGAKRHLQQDSPKLAICAYHKSEDLWKLFMTINSINSHYHFYLRHYSHTAFETILYAKITDLP